MELSNRNAFLLRLTVIASSVILLLPQHGTCVAVPQMGGGGVGASSSAPPAEVTRPPFPSKQDCDSALLTGQPQKDKSAFMTNLVARTQLQGAAQYVESNDLTHIMNEKPGKEVWKPANFTVSSNYAGTQGEMVQFQQHYSTTFARASSGEAYVLLGHEKKARANCTFYQFVLPALIDSDKIDKITWVDYSPGDPETKPIDQSEKTYWEKGQAVPAPDPRSLRTKAPQCSSTESPIANHCAINQVGDALAGTPKSSVQIEANECPRVGCAGDTGVFVCNHQNKTLELDNENIGLSVDELQQSCDMYYDSAVINCDKMQTPSMQQYYDAGFTIQIKGGEKSCTPLVPPPTPDSAAAAAA